MLDQINRDDGTSLLRGAGLGVEETFQWLEEAQTRVFGNSELLKEARDCGRLCKTAWAWLETLPLKSERDLKQEQAGSLLVRETAGLCWRFTRAWREELFVESERIAGSFPRLETLAESASKLCPGVYPSQQELQVEQNKYYIII